MADRPAAQEPPAPRSARLEPGAGRPPAPADRSSATDHELMCAIGRGEAGALAEVYERHGGHLHGVASRTCRTGDADDVVQDVLLRLWQRPTGFDPERGSLRAYLSVQVHGRAIDLFRATTSRRDRERAVEVARQRSPYREANVPADRDDQRTWGLLALLPQAQREPIALAYLFGFTYREVADSLGLPEGTVKTRIRTGLGRLHVLVVEEAAAEDLTG